jgi:hypothetical protein
MRYAYEGTMFEAQSASDLVLQLHEVSTIQAEDDSTWMKDISEALTPMGMRIRWDTPELFVEDLEKHGLIKRIVS